MAFKRFLRFLGFKIQFTLVTKLPLEVQTYLVFIWEIKFFFGDWYNTHVIELRIFCTKIYFRQKLRFCKEKTGLWVPPFNRTFVNMLRFASLRSGKDWIYNQNIPSVATFTISSRITSCNVENVLHFCRVLCKYVHWFWALVLSFNTNHCLHSSQ